MILKLFKSQHPFVLFVALILLILLWTGSILDYSIVEHEDFYGQTILFIRLFNLINPSSFLLYLIPILSIILQAIVIVRLNFKYTLIGKRTYLPAFIFIILSSAFVILQKIYPVYLAGPFIVFSISILFSTHKKVNPFSEIFAASFLIAISSFFFHYAIYLIVFVWICLIIIRSFNLREIFISIIGLIVPYLFLISYFFIFDNINYLFENFILIYSSQFEFPCLHYANYIFLFFVFILLIFSIFFSFNDVYIRKIEARKIYTCFIAFLLITCFIYTIFPSFTFFILLSIPLSFLLSIFLITWKNKILLEILFSLLFLSIIFIQFISFFY